MKNLLNKKEIPSSADYTVVALSEDGKVSVKEGVTMYTITFKDWDDSIISSQKYTEGATITVPSNPTREGYEFTSWTPTVSPIVVADVIYTANYKEVPTFEYVDLGLPSGTKWAKCNVGATSETDYGKYFQWGDTVGYYASEGAEEHSTWDTCPFNNGSSSYNSSYFTANSGTWLTEKAELKPEYDAAHVNMGSKWRMPTDADFKELTANTISKIATINGVIGIKFTNKTDSSKYIFIPAAGYTKRGDVFSIGDNGYIWSGKLHTLYHDNVYIMKFDIDNNVSMNIALRYNGRSVRGVLTI